MNLTDAPVEFSESTWEEWRIDTAASSLRFSVRHLVVSAVHGTFRRWGGTLRLRRGARDNRADPRALSVTAWVDLASVDTGSPERDSHVRSAEFFDIEHLPRAEFHSARVEFRDEQLVVTGVLALHGAEQHVELTASPELLPPEVDTHQRMVFSVRAAIDRQGFGLHWNQDLDVGGVVVGDRVEIAARVVLVRQSAQPARQTQETQATQATGDRL